MTVDKRALPPAPSRWYRGADIPMRVICRFASQVAERFCPDKIIPKYEQYYREVVER